MTKPTATGLAALAIVLSGPASAASATPEEAQRLTMQFERYLGHPAAGQPSSVTVTPDGESYRAVLDVGRLFSPLSALGFTVTSAGTFDAVLTPQADGLWHVTAAGLPPLGYTLNGQTSSIEIKGYKLDGQFDPRLATFVSSTSSTTGSTVHTAGPKDTVDARSSSVSHTISSAVDAGDGSVNVNTSQAVDGYAYSFEIHTPAADAEQPPKVVSLDLHAATFATHFDAQHERVAALDDLWTFLVDHPSKEALTVSQAELKSRLNALVPFASSLAVDLAATEIVVNTAQGRFGLADFSQRVDIGGDASKGGIMAQLKASGPTLPAGLVPTWASGLVPSTVDFTEIYGPIVIAAPLTAAIADLDLGAADPLTEQQKSDIAKSFASTSEAVLTIAPTTITTRDLTVKLEGALELRKPLPTGRVTISVVGLDKAIEQIRSSAPTEPLAAQVIGVLSAVKVMAKADGVDSYSWQIDAQPGQPMTVNGNPVAPPQPRPLPKKVRAEP